MEVIGIVLTVIAGTGVWMAVGYGVWRISRMAPNPRSVGTQIRATRAILKFCVEHGSEGPIDQIRECLRALESGDFEAAVERYRRIHWGAYGFNDWFPPVAFEHENEEYVWAVFEALSERWHRLMELFAKGQRAS